MPAPCLFPPHLTILRRIDPIVCVLFRLSRLRGGVFMMEAAQTLRALIGGFDLDPNRVLDIVLESLEHDCGESSEVVEAHLNLAQQLNLGASLPHVVGFKFQHYHCQKATPRSLFCLAATLLCAELISFESLLPHLAPSLEKLADQSRKDAAQTDEESRRFGVVSLGGSKEKDEAGIEPSETHHSLSLYEAKDTSQIFGVLESMLWDRRWHFAEPLLVRMERAGALPVSNVGCRRALCALAHFLIDPVYKALSPRSIGVASLWSRAVVSQTNAFLGAPSQHLTRRLDASDVLSLPQLLVFLEPLCHHLHIYVAFDALLLAKLSRIVKNLLQPCWRGNGTASVAKRLLEHVLLPALSLVPANPGCVLEIWIAVRCFAYSERHLLYKAWRGRDVERTAIGLKHHEVTRAECQAGYDTRQALKRVANEKKNSKHVGRALAKTAHSNPVIVFHIILSQIESYDNMIQPIIESFGFMTPLALDVLSFMLPMHLSDASRHKLQVDGIHISHWFQYLAHFTGIFYRMYPLTELRSLVDFLLARLKTGDSLELLVFNELLARMGGCEVLEDVSDTQIGGLAGGEALRRELLAFDKASRRAVLRLQDAICTHDTAIPMLALIAQSPSVSLSLLLPNMLVNISASSKYLGSVVTRFSREMRTMLNFLGNNTTGASWSWSSLLSFLHGQRNKPATQWRPKSARTSNSCPTLKLYATCCLVSGIHSLPRGIQMHLTKT